MYNPIIPQDPDELAFLEAQSQSGHIASDDPFTAYDIGVTHAMPYGNCASPDVNMIPQSDTDVKSDIALASPDDLLPSVSLQCNDLPEQPQDPKKEKVIEPAVYTYEDFVGVDLFEKIHAANDHVIINPDTGHGKTTSVEATRFKTLMAMPLKGQVQQREAKGSHGVYGGASASDIPKDALNVACTYNALSRVMAVHQFDMLVIDEFVHMATDAFRIDALQSAYNAIARFNGPITLMSATPLTKIMTNTIFPDFTLIECIDNGTKREKRNIKVVAVNGGFFDKVVGLAKSHPNHLKIIHVDDKTVIKGVVEKLNALPYGKAYGFTSDTSDEDVHKDIIGKGLLPDDAKFLVTTSVINDGLSINPQPNVILISRKSTLAPHDIKQLAARLRDGLDVALPDCVYLMSRESKDKPIDMSSKGLIFEDMVVKEYKRILAEQEDLLEVAKSASEVYSKHGRSGDALEKKLNKLAEGFTFINYVGGEPAINKIKILTSAFEANKRMNTGQLIGEVVGLGGFFFGGVETANVRMDRELSEDIAFLKDQDKLSRAEQFANVIEAARDQGVKLLERMDETHKLFPDVNPKGSMEAVWAILPMWRLVEKSNGDFNRVLDYLRDNNITSASKCRKMKPKILSALILEKGGKLESLSSKGHAQASAVMKLQSMVGDGTILDKEKITEVRTAMAKEDGGGLVGRWDSDKKAVASIRKWFEATRTTVRADGKKRDVYRVDGVFDLEVIRKSATILSDAKKVSQAVPVTQKTGQRRML